MKRDKNDIEGRLIDFAVQVIHMVENMPNPKSAVHLGGQLLRSGTSPSLNYREARATESRKDFIHKMKPVGPEQIQDTHEHDYISLCVS